MKKTKTPQTPQLQEPDTQSKRRLSLPKVAYSAFLCVMMSMMFCQPAYAATDVWTKAKEIMQDVYTQILAISTIAAIVTASVALLLMNFSRSGRTVDESRAWLKRICITWAIYMLKTKAPNGPCIFLMDGRCSVYPARTRTCRIYPLTVGPGERGRDFEYCLCLDRHRSHFTGSRVSVKDWLYQNFKREDKEYVKREYEIATELGKLMRAIDPDMRQGIVFKVIYYRYYNFDLDQPFQPQYEQNNRHLLADLHRIAREQ